MNSINAQIGRKVKELRESRNLSQEKLAEMLGIPRPAVSQIENGARAVSADELVRMSKALGTHVETLLGIKQEPQVVLEKEEVPQASKKPTMRINVPQENLNKFRQVLMYILDKVGAKPNIGETVIYKLLYFIDFDYYEKYEEQLIGAKYQRNHYGPAPIEFPKVVQKMIASKEIEKVKNKVFDFPQTKYLPLKKPDLSKLSARELELIDGVLHRLSDMTARQISEYSHEDIPWKSAGDGEIMEYESVFYRTRPYSVREYEDEDQ